MKLKRSSQLPDDEGFVFVTWVPDAPFQIVGRRALDGELCVGHILLPKEGGDWRGLLDVGGVEIITGLEAENLIQALIVERKRFNN